MEFKRSDRVAERIHQEVSLILMRGTKDPRVALVTVTAVDVSNDLSQAKIYYTAMGTDEEHREAAAGLKSATPFVRRELGRSLQMRHTPDIIFKYDTTLEKGNRIEEILRKLKEEEGADDQGDS